MRRLGHSTGRAFVCRARADGRVRNAMELLEMLGLDDEEGVLELDDEVLGLTA